MKRNEGRAMRILICVLAVLFSATVIGMEDELITRGFGLIPEIIQKVDVLKKGLSSSDIVDGTITLASVGGYCPLSNLVADIEITGTNVTLDLAGRSIIGTITISGSAVVVKNGAVTSIAPLNSDKAGAAITVHANAANVLVKRCHIVCADSILTGTVFDLVLSDTVTETYELVGTGTVFDSMPGRSGIEVSGQIVNVFDCSVIPGASASTTTTHAEDGGHAIILSGSANKVRVLDCIMITGDGGDAADGNGGNAGYGIYVKDTATHAEICHCTVFETGAGGDGSSSGGSGGHGIRIESTAVDIGVHHCRIRNTGLGGSPGGAAGKAILDSVTTSGAYSIVFSNFAHNIANTIKYDLRSTGTEEGIASPNPPDGTVLNSLANIYIS